MATVVIDAGHGGFDNGAMYMGRKEKDDNLRLALAVGKLLEERGYHVVYTRTTDVYQSPYEKAQIANEAGADYFISFHRNSGEVDNTYHGVQSLVYGGDPQSERLAESINAQLEKVGFANIGIEERPGLVVLRRTQMPAVLVEAGFINNDKDNEIFDEMFPEMAEAIARGIENVAPPGRGRDPVNMRKEETAEGEHASEDIRSEENHSEENQSEGNTKTTVYGVEVGRFLYENTANFMAERLVDQGFVSFVFQEGGLLHVAVGREHSVDETGKLQDRLRNLGYRTMMISSEV